MPHRNIFCIGKNYHEHAHEFSRSGFDSSAAAGAVPKHPIIFSKVPETVIPNGATVAIDPRVSTAIDYEAELAVIIGKPGRRIAREDAFDHVWGYTIINDVTARDLQARHSQWLVAKSQDTFCPMGPWAVSKDELDISDTAIRCLSTEITATQHRPLIFDILTIIATISEGVTLRPATSRLAPAGRHWLRPAALPQGRRPGAHRGRGIGVLENPVGKSVMTTVTANGLSRSRG
jgi:2-keto-4-pentenoate hydratase/2-oxohepta-3-ene-1,7-dioic acid hydratase in catechol pathway